jgi:hypothetical protein
MKESLEAETSKESREAVGPLVSSLEKTSKKENEVCALICVKIECISPIPNSNKSGQ